MADDFPQWTPVDAERLRAAAAELAAAVTAHATAVSAVTGEDGVPEVLAANDRLLPAVLAYADAQFDLTGNDFPFGVLHAYAEDEEADTDEADTDEDDTGVDVPAAVPDVAVVPATSGTTDVSVLQRHDLRVTDEAAVLAGAGEGDLGQALAGLARTRGWDSLGDVPGLRSVARSVLVVGQQAAPGAEPDADDGELLWSQQEVLPG
ncbi:hypothetical protein GCU67_02725 [Modestobacter muralis]|uniref:Uncharacterized protein n=1 Tax=Modestobacter muralis TaxID=1608614 RepID=A0A6P0H2A9_9ACTN|nr:hypothetical protein [Modestobacter muralis]NEK93091.1 hypothetical protein [Modestobacter muralis]NEN49858.1 hypothetical protein [Modestobacter muralis]